MRNLIVAAAAFFLGVAAAIVSLREPTEPLTAEALAAARERWQQADIRSYRVKYRMHGGVYEVTVRDGLVAEILLNGRTPSIAQVGLYSIPGLFEVLEGELEGLSQETPAGASGRPALARVRFHAELGFPQRYVRGSGGLGPPSSLEMLEFEAEKEQK